MTETVQHLITADAPPADISTAPAAATLVADPARLLPGGDDTDGVEGLDDRALLRTPAPRAGGRAAATAFDEPQLLRVLESQYGLGRWRQVRRTSEGVSNLSWFVDTDTGPVVLRRSHSLKTVPAAQFEAGLLAHLTRAGFPAPEVVPTADGGVLVEVDGVVHMVMRLLPGSHSDPVARAAQVREAARGLARYHRLAAGLRVVGAPATSSALAALGEPAHVRLADALDVAGPHLAGSVRTELEAALRHLAVEMAAVRGHLDARQHALTSLVVHGSYGRTALLFAGDRLTGVLDFDRATHDLLGLDLAYALKSFCRLRGGTHRGVGMDVDLCRAFLRHYDGQRPLADADLDALPLLLRAQRLAKVVRKCDNLVAKRPQATQPAKDAEKFAGIVVRESERTRWFAEHAGTFPRSLTP